MADRHSTLPSPAFAGEGAGRSWSLACHPDHPSLTAYDVTVTIGRRDEDFVIAYCVTGGERVVWPEPAPSERADGLWRTTCFELFLQFDDGDHYVEFNFSPSTQWAAYAFDGYRDGMTALDVAAPRIERTQAGVVVALDLMSLPRGEHRMALTAVIEEVDGTKSYWSLAHPPGAPDFHHPACFAARLPAPDGP